MEGVSKQDVVSQFVDAENRSVMLVAVLGLVAPMLLIPVALLPGMWFYPLVAIVWVACDIGCYLFVRRNFRQLNKVFVNLILDKEQADGQIAFLENELSQLKKERTGVIL